MNVDEPQDPQAKACAKIAKFWRTHNKWTLKKLVQECARLGVSKAKLEQISFDALIVFLREKPVIHATKRLLERIHRLSVIMQIRNGGSADRTPETVNVRVFLALYMISLRPTHVFESMSDNERILFDSSSLLLSYFEDIIQQLCLKNYNTLSVDVFLMSSFSTVLLDYLTKFKAWKIPDESKLTCRIKHALIALYAAVQHLPSEERVDSTLGVEFQAQIERLRNKLVQISGEPALQVFDELRLAAPPPSAVSSSGTVGLSFPSRMDNVQLAHELFINPAFTLTNQRGDFESQPCIHRIIEGFHRAFWDSLLDELLLEYPCYVRVIKVLGEIKTGIDEMASLSQRELIGEIIDLGAIKGMIDAKAYTWEDAKKLVAGSLQVIQDMPLPASADSSQTVDWHSIKDLMADAKASDQPLALCKSLEFMLDRVSDLRIAAANNRLRLIAPVIADHGVEYERGKYADSNPTDEYVKEWLRLSISNAEDPLATLNALKEGSAGASMKVLCAGFVQLVLEPGVKPETFRMDWGRLADTKMTVELLASKAAMLTVLSADSTRLLNARAQPAQGEVQALLVSVGEVIDNSTSIEGLMSIITDELCKTSLDALEQKTVLTNVDRVGKPGNPVYALFKTRVVAFWKKRFAKIPMETQDTEHLQAGAILIPLITKSSDAARRVFDLNVLVHGERYNRLIAEAVDLATV